MKTLLTFIACLFPMLAFSQGGPIIRNPVTTNAFMNQPSDGWVPVWNNAASKWSNAVNTASSTNLPAYLQTATLTNLQGTGLTTGATNASFFIQSSSGKGTNTDFWLVTEFYGDVLGASNYYATNGAFIQVGSGVGAKLQGALQFTSPGGNILDKDGLARVLIQPLSSGGLVQLYGTNATSGLTIDADGNLSESGITRIYNHITISSNAWVTNGAFIQTGGGIAAQFQGALQFTSIGGNISDADGAVHVLVQKSSAGGGTYITGSDAATGLTVTNNGEVYIGVGQIFPTLTASRALVLNAQGRATNAAGTPDGTKFLRDDNTYAVPPGSGSAINQTNSLVSSENTYLFSALRQRILTTNGSTATPRIMFAGDSLIGDPSLGYSGVASFVDQVGEMFGTAGTARTPFGRVWSDFSAGATPSPAWVGTNWWAPLSWGLPEGESITFIGWTNVNRIQVAWLQQPVGNASLGIYTNDATGNTYALCLSINGSNSTFAGAFTNIAVPLGNYRVQLKTSGGAALKTNVVVHVSGQQTNIGGASFSLFGAGGTTMTNFIAVPTAVKNPILSGLSPDAFFWEGVDFGECGGESGYTNALNALYDSITNACGTSILFGIIGAPGGDTVSAFSDTQNSVSRLMCQRRGWIYLDGAVTHSAYTNGLSLDGVHYNANGAALVGSSLGQQLGLFAPSAMLASLWGPLQTQINNAGGGTNFPNINLQAGNTNYVLSTGVRKAFYMSTNGSHGINLNLAVPNSGYDVIVTHTNSSGTDYTVTFYTNSVAASFYSLIDKTNATSWTVQAGSIVSQHFLFTGTTWLRTDVEGPLLTLAAGASTTLTTNGTVLTVAAPAVGGSAAIQFAEGTSLAGTNGTDTKFIYDRTNNVLRIVGLTPKFRIEDSTFLGTNEFGPTSQNSQNSAYVIYTPFSSLVIGGAIQTTNRLGLKEKSAASVIELDFNDTHKFSITNRISAATTLVETNGFDGQEMSVFMLGEASGGTDRAVTIVPQLGHLVANEDSLGSALSTSLSFTLVAGNGADIKSSIRRLNGTNIMGVSVRQFSFKDTPINNSPTPYTVPITGTNFIVDWLLLGPTNTVILTNYANAGLMQTNIQTSKERLTMLVQNGGQGFCNLITNGIDNQRMTAVQTGITRSTNGSYWDTLVWIPVNTNAVLSGQNWGARP